MSFNSDDEIFDKKFLFLLEAFKDQRDVIRSIDTKARFLLAVNLSFLGGLVYLLRVINSSNGSNFSFEISMIYYLLMIVLLSFVLYNIYKLVDVIVPQENPKENIKNLPWSRDNDISDIFFPVPKEQKFNFFEYEKKFAKVEGKEILDILSYEHLKLSWIRHIKIQKFKSAWDSFRLLLLFIFLELLCLVICS